MVNDRKDVAHQIKNTDSSLKAARDIGKQARRKLRAQNEKGNSIWSGLGMMGLVGWSIVVPTLFGALVGQYMDTQSINSSSGESRSWTLALLIAGLTLGCANAWHWVSKEDRNIHLNDGEQATEKRPSKRLENTEDD
jgi:ATP synthase protein I